MPTTYTIKSLTEAEYQAMREAAARAGGSINQWLLGIIRAHLPTATEDTAMTTVTHANDQQTLDERLSAYIRRALGCESFSFSSRREGSLSGWTVHCSTGYRESTMRDRIEELERRLPAYLRRLAREHGQEAAADSATAWRFGLGEIWTTFGAGILSREAIAAANSRGAAAQSAIDAMYADNRREADHA
jgi:hypothetical protein